METICESSWFVPCYKVAFNMSKTSKSLNASNNFRATIMESDIITVVLFASCYKLLKGEFLLFNCRNPDAQFSHTCPQDLVSRG